MSSSEIVPDVQPCAASDALGNTKSASQNPRKRWCFTLHNWGINDLIDIESWLCANCAGFLFSEETGETGETEHLQGYFELKFRKRLSWIKTSMKKNHIHLEGAKGTREENIEYIMKENGKKYGNLVPETIKIMEPVDELKFLIPLMNDYDGDRKIHVVVDTKGNLGKTEFARWAVVNYNRCIVTGGKAADMKNQIIEYKKRQSNLPKYIIIDIPRSGKQFISYQGLEEVKNMLFYSGKYEGGMVVGNKPFILVFANDHLDYEKMSEDRWNIHEISNADGGPA